MVLVVVIVWLWVEIWGNYGLVWLGDSALLRALYPKIIRTEKHLFSYNLLTYELYWYYDLVISKLWGEGVWWGNLHYNIILYILVGVVSRIGKYFQKDFRGTLSPSPLSLPLHPNTPYNPSNSNNPTPITTNTPNITINLKPYLKIPTSTRTLKIQ